MTADTQAQGDLPALALEHGNIQSNWRGDTEYVFSKHGLETFASALQGRGTQEGEPSAVVLRPELNHGEWLEFVAFWASAVRLHPAFDTEPSPLADMMQVIADQADQLRAALAQEARVSVEIREAM